MRGVVPGARAIADLWIDGSRLIFGNQNPNELSRLEGAIRDGQARSVIIPIASPVDERLMSRFLAKVAIEILAQRLSPIEGWEQELIKNEQLDPLRRYARIGDVPSVWPFSRRRIYGEDDLHGELDSGHQVLHEFTLLYTDKAELYAIVCLFGEEFAINLGGPETDGYDQWLAKHHCRSPLYLSDQLPTPGKRSTLLPSADDTLEFYAQLQNRSDLPGSIHAVAPGHLVRVLE